MSNQNPQVTLRVAGRGVEIKNIEEGVTTVAQLVGQSGGVFRVNGQTITNPDTFRVPGGAIVEWTQAPKSAR